MNSEQRLDNVNRTHLVLASGKLVLQKRLAKASYKLVASVNRSFEADPFQVEIENLAEKKKNYRPKHLKRKMKPRFLELLDPNRGKKKLNKGVAAWLQFSSTESFSVLVVALERNFLSYVY